MHQIDAFQVQGGPQTRVSRYLTLSMRADTETLALGYLKVCYNTLNLPRNCFALFTLQPTLSTLGTAPKVT